MTDVYKYFLTHTYVLHKDKEHLDITAQSFRFFRIIHLFAVLLLQISGNLKLNSKTFNELFINHYLSLVC